MLSFISRFRPRQCLELIRPPLLTHSDLSTARPTSQQSDTNLARLPQFNNAPLSPSIIQSGLTIDEVNYSISPTSRSHQGQLYQPDYSSQPELHSVENLVPLAASLGTEQATAVWILSQALANLACRGLWRISLMKYIYDLLQTCIVPRCCILSGWLSLDVFQPWQTDTQRRLWGVHAQRMPRFSQCFWLQSHVISYSCRREIYPAHGDNNGADDTQ